MTKPGIEQPAGQRDILVSCTRNMICFPTVTSSIALLTRLGSIPKTGSAMRKALVTLRTAGFSDEKSREILERDAPETTFRRGTTPCSPAQVLIREPRIVILDEPTGTMDPITKIDVKHSIMHSREEMEETFIVVSHDMEFVRDVCDRLALMRGGKIVQIGKTAEVLAQSLPKKSASYESTCSMTSGMITIHVDGERMEVREGSTFGSIISHHLPGSCVAIIRPQTQEQSQTGTLAISTTAGEVAIEITVGGR